MTWLYQYELKSIQRWILATDRLREMRGGSLALVAVDHHFRETVASIPGAEVLRAAGGVGMARFADRSEAQRLAAFWPLVVEDFAPGVHLVQAVAANVDALAAGLRAARNRVAPSLPPASPVTERAPHTGLAAVELRSVGGERPVPIDASTARKLRWNTAAGEPWGDLLPDGWRFADTVEELPPGYVAVLHADGAGVGKRVRVVGEGMRAFSAALEDATRAAVRAAILAVGADDQGRVPLRIIVLGGDDLTAIVGSAAAMTFARSFLRAFEAETAARAEPLHGGLSAGAGLAFVKRSWPFRDGYEVAERLCSAAKAPFRGEEHIPSALAFQRITTSLDEKMDERLTAAPYTLNDGHSGCMSLDQLRAIRTAIGSVPRGPLREWTRLVQEGRADAAGDRWARLVRVAKGRDRSSFVPFERALGDAGCDGPWLRGFESRTPLFDALALSAVERSGDNQ